MHASLTRLAALPATTLVCCAHEYTLANLRFARAVEPHSLALAAHEAECQSLRDRGLPTLPSTLGRERMINPYLRCDQPEVIASAVGPWRRRPGSGVGAGNDTTVERQLSMTRYARLKAFSARATRSTRTSGSTFALSALMLALTGCASVPDSNDDVKPPPMADQPWVHANSRSSHAPKARSRRCRASSR